MCIYKIIIMTIIVIIIIVIIIGMHTSESVLGVSPVALHPRERERVQVVHWRRAGIPAAQRPVRGDANDPGGVHVSSVNVYVHVIASSKGGDPARAAASVVSAVCARIVPAAAAAASVVRRVSVVRFMDPGAQHAALLHGAEDLIDAKANGLHVRVLLQMRPQHPEVIHGLSARRAPGLAGELEDAPSRLSGLASFCSFSARYVESAQACVCKGVKVGPHTPHASSPMFPSPPRSHTDFHKSNCCIY